MSKFIGAVGRLKSIRFIVAAPLVLGFFILGLLISSPQRGESAITASEVVDVQLGDGDLACQAPTDISGLYRLSPIIFVDVIGGYNSPAAAAGYFKYALPQMPFSELKQTQANDFHARFEISGKGIFIVEKNEEGLWQPYVYSYCPDLNWSEGV